MKLQLTIFDPRDGGAILSEAFFDVVGIEGPFTAPCFFGTDDPFKTVFYNDNDGKIGYVYFNIGDNTTGTANVYTNNLVKQYKLMD